MLIFSSNASWGTHITSRVVPVCSLMARMIGLSAAGASVVDSAALAEALENGEIAGAAVDVFEMEPPVPADHPLLAAPNLIATPHVAFASDQAFEKRAVIVCENIRQWLAGTPQNVIC